ncbi:hybrid sensor histidine kinase/response regulator [Ramlibacter tataouinensis]|uniref:histidine kinase n=1 Tax=Ramlibacter tataouinensis (strain ATCC BAA-407 / DSM 14655 / LMG 21543 / TTB310) TaxID=365046 RepID=F5Y601_RAMTT|nr:response regulator [Ramlibacter tataouinensis]AEG91505.1 candidate histidine kinase, hybrid [Ramlibacter tataouinensis TTB310]
MERRILIHAPQGQDARLAEKLFRSVGLDVGSCASDGELGAQLEQGVGALLVVEEAVAGALRGGLGRYLAQQPAWSDLPILVLAKHGADSLEAQRALGQLGNVTLMERPVRTMALVSAARSALRARERQYQVRMLNQRKDEFLATLAHELRNPLAPIRNAMSIIERQHPTPQTTRLVAMVERQVGHLKRLVDDLLDVARITSGKLELQRSLTTVDQVVTHAVEIAQAAIAEKGHRLAIEQPPAPVTLLADHTRLVQSVANLLVNAAKFTPPEGDVALVVEIDGLLARFAVRDSGKGLEPGSLERIFDMFEQARTVGEPTGGLGLGLHLTRAFAELHGGTVSARSEGLGRGSEFLLSLPVVVEEGRAQPGLAVAGAAGAALPRKVLVVDDNVDAALTLEALLSLHGLAVSVAHDGAAAVQRVQAEMPDAVVMDIGMPVMNGYEAARRIRSDFSGGKPLLIALTGWGQYADRTRAQEAGFDFHFVKPLAIDELMGCLSRSLPVGGAL